MEQGHSSFTSALEARHGIDPKTGLPAAATERELRDTLIEQWFDDDADLADVTDEQIIARIEDLVGEGWGVAGREMEKANGVREAATEAHRLLLDRKPALGLRFQALIDWLRAHHLIHDWVSANCGYEIRCRRCPAIRRRV